MNPYTVIGYYENNHQIFSHHLMAESATHAFWEASQSLDIEAVFISAISGHLTEGNTIEFPGCATVDSETIRNQPDIFGKKPLSDSLHLSALGRQVYSE